MKDLLFLETNLENLEIGFNEVLKEIRLGGETRLHNSANNGIIKC